MFNAIFYIIGELGEECIGRLDDLSTIANVPFRASTILVGVAVLIALLAICAMLMFFFCQSTTVFYMCAWMQVVSGSYLLYIIKKRKKNIGNFYILTSREAFRNARKRRFYFRKCNASYASSRNPLLQSRQ